MSCYPTQSPLTARPWRWRHCAPWLMWLITSIILQRPRFNTMPVHMGFVWIKWQWKRFFSKHLFSCQYHSTDDTDTTLLNSTHYVNPKQIPTYQLNWYNILGDFGGEGGGSRRRKRNNLYICLSICVTCIPHIPQYTVSTNNQNRSACTVTCYRQHDQ